jgi:ribonuclease HI
VLEDSDGLEPLNGHHIFIDGSYIAGSVGYGVVVLYNGEVIEELSGKVDEPHFLGMNQVGGELVGVLMAVEWCSNNQIDSVSLHYDYKGIYQWANGDWKANKPGTLLYQQEAQKWNIKIDWQKVESHSGNRWNDQADRLAKKGTGKIDQDNKEENVFNIERRAIDFLNYINGEGICGAYMGVINEQFARISIDPSGYIDIYNTKKRSINDPYMHGFKETKQKDVEYLWNQFLYGNKKEEDQIGQLMKKAFKNVQYYYNILNNYRDCEFDFIDFASALNDVSQLTEDQHIDFTKIRHNFDLLEAHYKRLMKETDYGHQSNPG